MEAGEYRKLRYAGGKLSLQQLKKWNEEREVIGEVKGGMYFVDLQAAVSIARTSAAPSSTVLS
jgi:hypothetical protein